MSIWICRRAALGLCAALLLAGCDEMPARVRAEAGSANLAANAPRPAHSFAVTERELVAGKLVVRGPQGYCLDRRSIRTGASGGFALLASCAALGGEASGLGVEPVLMTVQVQPQLIRRGQASAAGLSEALAGRDPVYEDDGDGMSFVQLARGGDALIPNGEPKHWRAALSVNGQLIGLALYSEKGGAAATRTGKLLLIAFAEAILEASPVASAQPE